MSVAEICRKAKITDYLESQGVELIKSGRKTKCSCPLPGHEDDDTPSFYIGEFKDGGQYFKCFGCEESGGIVSLVRLMENRASNGEVVRILSERTGVEMGKFDPYVKIEPAPDEVLQLFCEEEYAGRELVTYARQYLKHNGGSFDAVNKVSRLYAKLDSCLEKGDSEGINGIMNDMIRLLIEENKGRKRK